MGLEEEFKFLDQKDFGTEAVECYPELQSCVKVKFIYSEKATKFCEIFPLLLTVCTVVKSKGKISKNFAALSEYRTRAIITRSWFETALVYKPRILGLKNEEI